MVIRLFLACCVLAWAASVLAQAPPRWLLFCEMAVEEPGLIKARLPLDTLSAAQPSLADMRLVDPWGREIPFFLDQPMAVPAKEAELGSLHVTMERDRTIITGEAPELPAHKAIEALAIYSPATSFLKPVSIDVLSGEGEWVTLLRNQPIHKQLDREYRGRMEIPKGRWPRFRIIVDDSQGPPIPIERVTAFIEGEEAPALEQLALSVPERAADSLHTDLRIRLPASNLMVHSIVLETGTPAFPRRVTVLSRVFKGDAVREETMVSGTFSWFRAEGPRRHESLSLPISSRIPSRELTLRTTNLEGPLPEVRAVEIRVVPTYVFFDALHPGKYLLMVGNPRAEAKGYPVQALKERFRTAEVRSVSPGPTRRNPDVQASFWDVEHDGEGSTLDISPWGHRRKILVKEAGIQRLELDPETMAHGGGRISDLRILRQGRQVPYLMDHTGLARHLEPRVEAREESPRRSQWIIVLPCSPLPISHISCTSPAQVFRREVRAYEEIKDRRGETSRHLLGRAEWSRAPGQTGGELALQLASHPKTDRIFLMMDHGDNEPVHLEQFRCYYRAPKLLFRASPGEEIFLYYGNQHAPAPRYDLTLLGPAMAEAEPHDAALGPEELLKSTPWWALTSPSGPLKYVFWGLLALVVLVLLGVIRKLLPSQQTHHEDGG